jgi:hypothetical protein
MRFCNDRFDFAVFKLGELCWIVQKLFLKYLSSYGGRQAIHSCFSEMVFKMSFHYTNFARFLLSYVWYLSKNILTVYNPTPVYLCVVVINLASVMERSLPALEAVKT